MAKLDKKQKRVWVENEEGAEEDGGWEEYVDYIYPDDPLNFREPKLLRKAHEWSKKLMDKAKDAANEATGESSGLETAELATDAKDTSSEPG